MALQNVRSVLSIIRDILFIAFLVLLVLAGIKAAQLASTFSSILPFGQLDGAAGESPEAGLQGLLMEIESDFASGKYSSASAKINTLESIAKQVGVPKQELAVLEQLRTAVKKKDSKAFYALMAKLKQDTGG